jgi:hypothetical protein
VHTEIRSATMAMCTAAHCRHGFRTLASVMGDYTSTMQCWTCFKGPQGEHVCDLYSRVHRPAALNQRLRSLCTPGTSASELDDGCVPTRCRPAIEAAFGSSPSNGQMAVSVSSPSHIVNESAFFDHNERTSAYVVPRRAWRCVREAARAALARHRSRPCARRTIAHTPCCPSTGATSRVARPRCLSARPRRHRPIERRATFRRRPSAHLTTTMAGSVGVCAGRTIAQSHV